MLSEKTSGVTIILCFRPILLRDLSTRCGLITFPSPKKKMRKKILFVCTGNTCRSPMAEALFRKMLRGNHDDVVPLSAGIQATAGTPASPVGLKVLAQQHGIDFSFFKSQSVSAALVEEATAVFAMTLDHLCILSQRYPEHRQKFFLLNENGKDIPDPIGGSIRTYEECCAAIQSSLQNLLVRLANN